jgi:hypothetical protein
VAVAVKAWVAPTAMLVVAGETAMAVTVLGPGPVLD